jgi:hypothetical protein
MADDLFNKNRTRKRLMSAVCKFSLDTILER